MSEEEIRFHFLRWQQAYKTSKDYWQTSHFLEATINNVPNLIWRSACRCIPGPFTLRKFMRKTWQWRHLFDDRKYILSNAH